MTINEMMNQDHVPDVGKKVQEWNGGYIKASQEAYDLLVEAGCNLRNESKGLNKKYYSFYSSFLYHKEFDNIDEVHGKQFYINNKALSWDEPIQTNNMEDLNNLDILGDEMLSDGEENNIKLISDDIEKNITEFELTYTCNKNRVHKIIQSKHDDYEFEIIIKTKKSSLYCSEE